jgi:membrane-associated progesterone receptor component
LILLFVFFLLHFGGLQQPFSQECMNAFFGMTTKQKQNKQYITILAAVTIGYIVTSRALVPDPSTKDQPDTPTTTVNTMEDPPDPPRNFTKEQLRYFDGGCTKVGANNETAKPVYLSLQSIVFDVTKGREFYGPGGPYETFAGRECGAALAKMSFDEEWLDDPRHCQSLNFGELQTLEEWRVKFEHYRGYPIVGRLIVPLPDDPDRIISPNELAAHTGRTGVTLPEGYATPPIYVAVDGLVFDMSFGGVPFYGEHGPYHKFAGQNVTRALALMKIDEADSGNHDVSDLTEKQMQTMKDWVKTFRERKQYPVVGKFIPPPSTTTTKTTSSPS